MISVPLSSALITAQKDAAKATHSAPILEMGVTSLLVSLSVSHRREGNLPFCLDVCRAPSTEDLSGLGLSTRHMPFNVVDLPKSRCLYVSTQGGLPANGSSGTVTVSGDRLTYQAPPDACNTSIDDVMPYWLAQTKKTAWVVAEHSSLRRFEVLRKRAKKIKFALDGYIQLTADAELFEGVKNAAAPLPDELKSVATSSGAVEATFAVGEGGRHVIILTSPSSSFSASSSSSSRDAAAERERVTASLEKVISSEFLCNEATWKLSRVAFCFTRRPRLVRKWQRKQRGQLQKHREVIANPKELRIKRRGRVVKSPTPRPLKTRMQILQVATGRRKLEEGAQRSRFGFSWLPLPQTSTCKWQKWLHVSALVMLSLLWVC